VTEGQPAARRTDRTSRIVAIVIIASIIVPVVWLVVSAALRGPDAVNFDDPPPTQLRAPTTSSTVPVSP
jgi:hypothetical protein